MKLMKKYLFIILAGAALLAAACQEEQPTYEIHDNINVVSQNIVFMPQGGSGSIVGSMIGVVIIEILLELIRPLQEYQMLLYGILLLIVIIALPGGIVGGFKDVMADRAKRKLQKEEEGQS